MAQRKSFIKLLRSLGCVSAGCFTTIQVLVTERAAGADGTTTTVSSRALCPQCSWTMQLDRNCTASDQTQQAFSSRAAMVALCVRAFQQIALAFRLEKLHRS